MIEQLKNILPEKRIDEFLAITKEKSVKASNYFIRAGEVPRKIALVTSGLFRYVYTSEKGDEFTKGIIAENLFLSSYSAMIMGRPSYFSIEALEDSKILEISWKDFTSLLSDNNFWVEFLLKFVEKGYMIKEKRKGTCCCLTQKLGIRTSWLNFQEWIKELSRE
jgi:CRP-like cAMP-binding protein